MPRPPRLMVRSVLNYEKGRTSNQTFSLMRGPLVLKKRLLSSQLGISRAQSVRRQHRLPSSNYITTTAAAPSGAFVPSIILRYPPIIPLVRQQSAQKRRPCSKFANTSGFVLPTRPTEPRKLSINPRTAADGEWWREDRDRPPLLRQLHP